MKGDLIKLQGEQVLEELQVIAGVQKYSRVLNKGTENEKEEEVDYLRATCRGRNFTVTPEFAKAWNDGEIASCSLVDDTYEREVDGEKVEVHTYRISGFMTWSQKTNMAKKAAGIKRIDLELIRDFKLDPAVQKQMEEAI